MEIKSIKELSDSIELQLGGTLNIKKDTIAEWYEKYCKEDPQPQPEPAKASTSNNHAQTVNEPVKKKKSGFKISFIFI